MQRMNMRYILPALVMLLMMWSCDGSELTQEPIKEHIPLTIKATIPVSAQSRAQVVYGTPMVDGVDKGEILKWNYEDEINILNLSKLAKCPFGIKFFASKISEDGTNAVFSTDDDTDNFIEKGDLILAIYGEINRYAKKDAQDKVYYPRDIITMESIGCQANKPQYIVSDPTGDNDGLSGMKHNLKMYALVTATSDNEVPDLSFQHLSTILRVTLRNQSGHDIYPTSLDFKYPGTESFFNTTLYLSVTPDKGVDKSGEGINEEGKQFVWSSSPSILPGYNLTVYGGDEFFNGSDLYTDNIGTTINGKDNTADKGGSIINGESYELYITAVPRMGNDRKGDKFTISLVENHVTANPFAITIEGFDVAIEAGKRYWFDLTATPEGNLVLSSQYKP